MFKKLFEVKVRKMETGERFNGNILLFWNINNNLNQIDEAKLAKHFESALAICVSNNKYDDPDSEVGLF